MRKVSLETINKVESWILEHGRELEKARFNYLFNNGSSEDVVEELRIYQNTDGGFGHGLEPDFQLPESSPMASTIAFQIFDELKGEEGEELIKKGIEYFEQTYNNERQGWYALSKEVNQYPHAPWWEYDLDTQMTLIDYSWGNPSAEIIGYLYKYRKYVTKLDPEKLVDYAITQLLQKSKFDSEHEIFCYIRMYKNISQEKKTVMQHKLNEAVNTLVCTNPAEWVNYTPQPVHFANTPEMDFGIKEDALKVNLDYLIQNIEKSGVVLPNWQWTAYPVAWEKAKDHWTGVLNLRVLSTLQAYGRM